MTLKFGLTGGIASGKSTVTHLLADAGVPIVDTDQLARELVMPGEPCLDRIVRAFGSQVLDETGALDRASLRRIVFTDKASRQRLEHILHPPIRRMARERAMAVEAPCVCVVVPLLAEQAAAWSWLDKVIVIDCPAAIQRARLAQRPGITAELAEEILDAQASRARRLAIADHVLDNSGSIEDLKPRVEALRLALCGSRD
ncbi:MAG: dephospho-CoA kinase [Halothiobacillaceae bacterium]